MVARRMFCRLGWWVLALVLISLAPPWSVSSAADGEAVAASGFIVDTGDGEPIHVVVTFDEPSLSAVELLRAADLEAVTVEFGGLGEAVCSIARTGCDVSTCRQRVCQSGDPDSPFWQYWEQGPDGAWALSQRGASHAEVTNGDIAAWVWTGVEPDLPEIAWRELAERAGAPDAVAAGEISGDPAVYSSGSFDEESEAGDYTDMVLATAAVAGVGVAGGWLVVRQRRRGSLAR